MNCKNTECQNETKGKNIYCSRSCRNQYVNKYMRDYTKCSNTFKNNKEEKERKYLENPKYCKECEEIIPFEKKRNLFCSNSCSTKYTNKNRKVTWGNKISESLQKYFDAENNTKQNSKVCLNCSNQFHKNKLFCSIDCKRTYERNNMDSFKGYRLDCNFNFNLADYPEEFDFNLIEQYGWYSPSNKKNNLGGVSRDHILSVKDGFESNINPKVISHPANCQLLIHSKNISKHRKSSITLEELMIRIEKFDKKYNGV
jgi:hypothetical protein